MIRIDTVLLIYRLMETLARHMLKKGLGSTWKEEKGTSKEVEVVFSSQKGLDVDVQEEGRKLKVEE
jgi:hypothetical protein